MLASVVVVGRGESTRNVNLNVPSHIHNSGAMME